jgi:hypothetical protein
VRRSPNRKPCVSERSAESIVARGSVRTSSPSSRLAASCHWLYVLAGGELDAGENAERFPLGCGQPAALAAGSCRAMSPAAKRAHRDFTGLPLR